MRRVVFGLLGIYWLALFVGTHIPISAKQFGQGGDKVLHLLAYAGLAFLMSLGIGGRRPTWRTLILVLVATMIYAGFDEFSQLLVGRQCDFWDWVADCFGVGFGLFGYWVATMIFQFWLLNRNRPEAEIAKP